MANYIPLVIEVEGKSRPSGVQTKWEPFKNMQIFTRDIVTPAISLDSNDVAAIVSGVPTAYARANLFNNAMNYNKGADDGALNLNAYYGQLASEWRGFIACIALDHQRVEVERVKLTYSDGKDIKETANIYEPKGAFGNMLFERKMLWSDLEAQGPERGIPFIDVIKYDGKVVGATSPDCLLFTSVSYKVQPNKERPFVDFNTGRFIDPLKNDMQAPQTLSLYAYVRHLSESLDKLSKYYEGVKSSIGTNLQPNYSNLVSILESWLTEIEKYAAEKGYKLDAASTPQVECFQKPFSLAFNFKNQLYGINGTIVTEFRDGAIEFNPKDLMLPSDAEIARLIISGAVKEGVDRTSKLPVYVMPAEKKDHTGAVTGTAYFALPLSTLGVSVFGDNIGALVGQASNGSAIKSKMTAVYFEENEYNNLEVKLTLQIENGTTQEIPVVYTVKGVVRNADIIIWPNFISKYWDRYYLYSEMPHYTFSQDFPFRAVPFVGDKDNDFQIIPADDNLVEPLYLAKANQPQNNETKNVKVELHIESNDKTAGNKYKYEIYESNQPFKGLKLTTTTEKHAGFLIVRYDVNLNSDYPHIVTEEPRSKVRAGVDFGSTNTSVAFCDSATGQVDGLQFKNRRVSLLSIDEDDNGVADEKHLLFFQSNPIKSNAIKSVLTLHDPNRLSTNNGTLLITEISQAVKGGFPCFSSNLPIASVTDKLIQLNCAKCGPVNQVHNMKWVDDDIDKAYKVAFLSSLMQQVYAELFDRNERFYPECVIWSFPSAMSRSLLNSYEAIWSELSKCNPLTPKRSTGGTGNVYELKVSSHNNSDADDAPQANPFGGSNDAFGNNDPFGGNSFGSSFGGGSDPFAGGGGLNGDPFGGNSGFGSSAGFGGDANGSNPFGGGKDAFGAAGSVGQQNAGQPQFVIDNDDEKIEFNVEKIVGENISVFQSMTEACAVANYLSSLNTISVRDRNTLTVCFDIGGSTTDISALTMLDNGSKLTMIKQSSIRFAAQRVSQATKFSPNFQKVLLQTCDNFGLKIQGLNLMESKFTPATAPYYFEQMVDRLTADQLPFFYKQIAINCRDLFCVNLYVTGLIMYYAGMIVKKLIKQVRNSKECSWLAQPGQPAKPYVNIVFAGKGARIMEWLSVTNGKMAMEYYLNMFMGGMGGNQEAAQYLPNYPRIVFPQAGLVDVKYEVSKGLTIKNTSLYRPQNEAPMEIIGEGGFSLNVDGGMKPVSYDNSITPDMIRFIGSQFYTNPVAGDKFVAFIKYFYTFAKENFNMTMPWQVIEGGLRNMNITAYIQNLPEYHKAKQSKGGFDFVAPIIVLEGMKFYDEFLLKGINAQ
jgi:hypothetical protein